MGSECKNVLIVNMKDKFVGLLAVADTLIHNTMHKMDELIQINGKGHCIVIMSDSTKKPH